MDGQLRHMLRDDDVNHDEQKQIIALGLKFRENRFYKRPFEGPQGVAVLFDKPSTRTRSSFSIGVAELGGYPLVIDKSGSQLGRGEPDDAVVARPERGPGAVRQRDRQAESIVVVDVFTDQVHPSGC